jgi:hypothetical protein
MRYFSFIIVAVCLLGCASKEDKAIDAINKYMYKTLDDYTGYEIVEIKMDSFFTSIYNNPLAPILIMLLEILSSYLKAKGLLNIEVKTIKDRLS